MKKKIIGVTLIATFIAVTAFNINLSRTEQHVGFTMENVEALANESGLKAYMSCYKTISSDGTGALVTKIWCDDCKEIQCRTFSANDDCYSIL